MQRSKGMTPRVGHNSCRPVNVLYYMNPTEAPPEAWRDDGRADGILPRTLADVERETAERLERIAAMCAGQPKRQGVHSGSAVVLIGHGKVLSFPSLKAAAEAVGVPSHNVGQLLKNHANFVGGYIWKVQA
jgi:hypothetical protein